MLPLREDVASRGAPLAVGALLALNALCFVFVAWWAPEPEEAASLVERWGFVPRLYLGALASGPDRVWLTPLSAMFLHGGLLHLAGNGLYLWIFGRAIEDVLGRRRFLLLYFVSGVAAAAVHGVSAPTSFVPAIGSSGAVAGLLGAYAVSYPGGRLRLLWPPVRVPAIGFLLAWIALQLVSGVSHGGETGGGIAWWSHVGGFAAGAALARPMWLRRPQRARVRI